MDKRSSPNNCRKKINKMQNAPDGCISVLTSDLIRALCTSFIANMLHCCYNLSNFNIAHFSNHKIRIIFLVNYASFVLGAKITQHVASDIKAIILKDSCFSAMFCVSDERGAGQIADVEVLLLALEK